MLKKVLNTRTRAVERDGKLSHREKSKRTRDGIVPDLRWRDEDGEFVLGDVKTIGFGKTRYWGRSPASIAPYR